MIDLRIPKRLAVTICGSALISIVLGFVAGYRPFGIGLDFFNYEYFYSEIWDSLDFSYFRFEPGFVWTAFVSKQWLHLDYMAFAAGLMAISLFIKTYHLSKLQHPILTIAFYLACWFPLHENTQIRTAFAIALLFMTVEQMFRHHWARFALLSILASSFHITALFAAIVLVGAYWLSSYSLSFGLSVITITGTVLFTLFDSISPYFPLANSLLQNPDFDGNGPKVFSAVNVATLLFLVLSATSGSLIDRRSRTYFLVSCSGLAIFLAFLPAHIVAYRLKELLLVFMTFIAFEYRISLKTLPQTATALILAAGSLYLSIASGLLGN